MGNLIGYKDLFDFSDDKDIQAAIQGIADLKKSYLDFKQNVTGSAITMFEGQLANIASEVKKVSEATKELNITNEKQQETLLANLDVIQKLKDENEKLRASKKGAKDTEKALEDSVNGLNAKLKEQLALFNKMSKEADPAALKNLAAEIQVTRFEITELNNATKGTTSSFQAARGSYAALDAETKQLVKDLQQMNNGLDVNNVSAQKMIKQISENTAKLKAFDSQIGQNFRNVGNYKSAFDGLGMSIQQILREAPSAAVSMNTFFLAISNNLPIFFDQITKINEELKIANQLTRDQALAAKEQAIATSLAAGATQAAAIAEGELAAETVLANAAQTAAPGILSRIGSSLFSLNTFLTVGVLLLTLYGGKITSWLETLFTGKKVINDSAENLKNLNEVMSAADKDAAKQSVSLKALYESATNANIPMKDRLLYVKELQKEFPKYFGSIDKENILNGKSSEVYRQLTKDILQNAKARAAQSKITDLASQQLDLEFGAQKVNNAVNNEINSAKDSKQNIGMGQTVTYTAEQQRNAAEARRKKALDDINDKKAALQRQQDFLVKFAGGEKAIADSIVTNDYKVPKDTSDRDAKKAERELAAAIKKHDELIQASAKYQVAQAELVFSKSAQQEEDSLLLESKRLSILEKSYAQRLGLYAKDSKQYFQILGEKAKAEKENEDAVLKIHEKGIEDRTKIALGEAQADYNRTNQGWVAEAAFEALKLQILEKSFDERLTLYKDDAKKYQDVLDEKVNAEAASAEKQRKIRLQQNKGAEEVAQSQTGERDSLFVGGINKDKAAGLITAIQAEDKLHNYRTAIIEDEIRQNEIKGAKLTAGDADYFENLKALGGLRKQLADENSAYEISKAQEVHDTELALRQAIFDFVKQGSQSLYEVGRELNQANIDDLTAAKDKELAVAGNNATARAQIEANYQKKIIDLKRKQAIYDKLEALLNIGLNTAVAVTAAWKSPLTAPFMIPLIIATGALQAAAVIAKPLPKYYKGRGKGKPEWAEVNELGAELIENNGNYRFAGEGKKTTTFLSPNDVVHTAEETNKIIRDISRGRETEEFFNSLFAGTKIVHSYERSKEDKLINAIIKSKLSENILGGIFEGAINKMERDYFSVNEKGFSYYTKTMSGRIQHLNSRNSINGNG